jgi:hypothetical protein
LVEQRKIVLDELGDVGVFHGSDEDSIFVVLWIASLELSSHDQDGLDGSHTEIVVILV